MLGRRIAARPMSPATVRDLEIALLEEWNSIPQSLIDNLIASMANRELLKLNLSKSEDLIKEVLNDAATVMNLTEMKREERILQKKEQIN
ncbi:hypothetical protein TNCV_3383081 [Trichonephila clavipes]|nr:hypothetical protein TNCV_3383081 [Trichonephila clavipes]